MQTHMSLLFFILFININSCLNTTGLTELPGPEFHWRFVFVPTAPSLQREITRKLTYPKQPTNPFLEMVKFLLERIAPVHIDSEAIRSETDFTLGCTTS